jgi:polyhydroxybutyrate depolymerase
MTLRKILVGAALLIVGLPVTLIAIVAVSIWMLNRTNGTIVTSGEARKYLLHVPPGYDSARPTPLVISLHGVAGWPAQQMKTTRWDRLADEQGFIVVYPSGTDHPRMWHVERGDGLQRDVRFISDLIDALEKSYNIDPARVYANGLSNGGGMAFVLSCTLSDRIAAVGMVAAAETLPWDWCADLRPVPMIAFHGTADPLVPYDGGLPTGALAPSRFDPHAEPFPVVREWTASWARRNRCAPDPADTVVAPDVTRREYGGCADDAAVVLYTIRGGGHSWPGGRPLPKWMVGPTSNSVDATAEMWKFFREHPLRAAKTAGRNDVTSR